MVYCSRCGSESNSDESFCDECGNLLMNEKYLKLNRLESFAEIANDHNMDVIENNPLSDVEYAIILRNIEEMARDYLNDFENEFKSRSTLGKVKLLALCYANVSYKHKGAELGKYSFNHIEVDDRLDDCDIISTLIHELAHHLFNEILEQMLMYIWEVEKSDALEAYVSFTIGTNPVFILANEYCAHTVEGRFIPHGYQRYSSFNKFLTENFDVNNDSEMISYALTLGNSIADDIIHILEKFITKEIRHEIKLIFSQYNKPTNYDDLLLEQEETFSTQEKLNHLHILLMSGITIASSDIKSEEIFSMFEEGYIQNNIHF